MTAAPGSGPGGVTGGNPGSAGPCAPTVNVSVQTPAGGQGVILETSKTTGAARIAVDVNGDGQADYNGPATLPFLKIAVPVTTQARIGVTAIGACGATSTTTVQPKVVGTGLPADQMGTRIVAAASPALLTPAPISSTCTQGDIVEGIIEARGCFVQVKSAGAAAGRRSRRRRQVLQGSGHPVLGDGVLQERQARNVRPAQGDLLGSAHLRRLGSRARQRPDDQRGQ